MSVSTAWKVQTCRKGEHLHNHVISALAKHPAAATEQLLTY